MKLGLFTADQAATLCRLSTRQLSHWNRTGFFQPRLTDEKRRPFNKIYTFRDLVGLRTISLLRNRYNVRLKELRRIGHELEDTPEGDWSKLVLYTDATNHIYFQNPRTGAIESPSPLGQRPLLSVNAIIRHIERNLVRANKRKPSQIGKVEQNRYIVRNEPVIAGTRIPTGAIYRLHEAGLTEDQILKEYPRLTLADVQAAIQHEQLRVAS